MGGATPDAYRIGTGQVARDYPADAAPVRLSKQPSLPTMSRAPGCVSAKQILSWQGVLGTPVVRLPHVLSEPAVVEAMRSDLRDSVIAHSIQNS